MATPENTATRQSGRIAHAWRDASCPVRILAAIAVVLTGAVATTAPVSSSARAALAATGVLFVMAALVDVREHRIPNVVTASAAVVGLATTAAQSADTTLVTVAGLVIGAAPMLVVHRHNGVGLGDVKLAGAIGASSALVALIAAPLAIAIAALSAATASSLARRPVLPLAPACWLGWATAVAVAGWVIS